MLVLRTFTGPTTLYCHECHFQTVDACCEICLHDLSTERLEELLDFCSILLSNKFGKLYQFKIVQALNTFMP